MFGNGEESKSIDPLVHQQNDEEKVGGYPEWCRENGWHSDP